MISRIETKWRKVRRLFSRSHWLTRMLGLPVRKGQSNRPGLVMIQVDGLSRPQFERAAKNGEMPFLKKLMTKEHYTLHTNYSGLPASTPAVQAEIFYGIKTAVPAFSFMDHETREVIRMYEPAGAAKVEQRIVAENYIGLLSGGSAYSDNFTGGAKEEEAHFCASSMGWGAALKAANPFALLVLLLSNLNSVLRIIVFSLLEVVISFVDFFRGVAHGRNFLKELKFIPTRVAICIMLRELCVIGGKIDISRGLPIVHINFLGYDEQAHRRGPESKFAHWTLKGIDDAIKRLSREASLSKWRDYEVWVYSDHGQSVATSYVKRRGYSIREAVKQAISAVEPQHAPIHAEDSAGVETHRARLLGGDKTQRVLKKIPPTAYSNNLEEVQVIGLGPVGFVNFPQTLDPSELVRVAKELVSSHKVPVVISGREGDQLRAFTEEGEFLLPQQTAEVFGDDHPFREVIGEDLERLCRHVDGGDLTLLGWKKDSENITFATENGSHAGLTHGETTAFSLLPPDAPLAHNDLGYYRPTELREAALRYLGRLSDGSPRADVDDAADKFAESVSDKKKVSASPAPIAAPLE